MTFELCPGINLIMTVRGGFGAASELEALDPVVDRSREGSLRVTRLTMADLDIFQLQGRWLDFKGLVAEGENLLYIASALLR